MPAEQNRENPVPARFIDGPRHAKLQHLHRYWADKRGSRLLPSRSDINPAEIKSLLPNVMLWSVEPSGERYIVRLVGDNIVNFGGTNYTGQPATVGMPPAAAQSMLDILGQVVSAKAPRFRIGKAFWSVGQSYRDFEACFLPLSADGETVNMVLGGIVFDMAAPA